MIGAPARQSPGGDLVPFCASSTQRDEVAFVFATIGILDIDHLSGHGRPVVPCHRTSRHRAFEP
jgi:hypothetical protein